MEERDHILFLWIVLITLLGCWLWSISLHEIKLIDLEQRIESMEFFPGDTLKLRTGQIWREQLTVPSDYLIITSYDSTGGENPLIK